MSPRQDSMALAAIAAVTLAAAGTPGCDRPSRLYRDIIDAYLASLGYEPLDCGEEQADWGTPGNQAGRQCLVDAFDDAVPARFTSVRKSTEGEPITSDYFVEVDEGVAGVVFFLDQGRDDDAADEVWRYDCSGVYMTDGGLLSLTGCDSVQVLTEVP